MHPFIWTFLQPLLQEYDSNFFKFLCCNCHITFLLDLQSKQQALEAFVVLPRFLQSYYILRLARGSKEILLASNLIARSYISHKRIGFMNFEWSTMEKMVWSSQSIIVWLFDKISGFSEWSFASKWWFSQANIFSRL